MINFQQEVRENSRHYVRYSCSLSTENKTIESDEKKINMTLFIICYN